MDYNIIAFIDSIKLAMGALVAIVLIALVVRLAIYIYVELPAGRD